MGNSVTESRAKFIDDTLGLDHLVLFYDGLRKQCTDAKTKVCANIGIMTTLPKASLYGISDVLICLIFGRSYVMFFHNHSHVGILGCPLAPNTKL